MMSIAVVAMLAGLPGCAESDPDAEAKRLIASQCAACHVVPGVAFARGRVGPSLAGMAQRSTIAGRMPNSPANLRLFLLHPQAVQPGGAMPELSLNVDQADILANYLSKH